MLVPPLVPAMSEAAAMFEALRVLTEQVKVMAERNQSGGKKWDNLDRFKTIKQFDGKQQEFEEWNVKFRSLVSAGDRKVGQLMSAIEKECTEDELAKGKFNQLEPEFGREDETLISESSASMFNLLLNITTGEANAMVRRSLGMGWLAWKRLTSSLNPRTLASGGGAYAPEGDPGHESRPLLGRVGRQDGEVEH